MLSCRYLPFSEDQGANAAVLRVPTLPIVLNLADGTNWVHN